jgi:hypothetical protein
MGKLLRKGITLDCERGNEVEERETNPHSSVYLNLLFCYVIIGSGEKPQTLIKLHWCTLIKLHWCTLIKFRLLYCKVVLYHALPH